MTGALTTMGISQKCLYSCQHTNVEFVSDPHNELELRLEELISNEQFRQRFEAFVAPMVYNREPHDFGTFFASLEEISVHIATP